MLRGSVWELLSSVFNVSRRHILAKLHSITAFNIFLLTPVERFNGVYYLKQPVAFAVEKIHWEKQDYLNSDNLTAKRTWLYGCDTDILFFTTVKMIWVMVVLLMKQSFICIDNWEHFTIQIISRRTEYMSNYVQIYIRLINFKIKSKVDILRMVYDKNTCLNHVAMGEKLPPQFTFSKPTWVPVLGTCCFGALAVLAFLVLPDCIGSCQLSLPWNVSKVSPQLQNIVPLFHCLHQTLMWIFDVGFGSVHPIIHVHIPTHLDLEFDVICRGSSLINYMFFSLTVVHYQITAEEAFDKSVLIILFVYYV